MFTMTIERHFSVDDVAKALKVSARTIFRWVESGEIKAVKIGGKRPVVRIPASELRRLGVNVIDDQGAGDDR